MKKPKSTFHRGRNRPCADLAERSPNTNLSTCGLVENRSEYETTYSHRRCITKVTVNSLSTCQSTRNYHLLQRKSIVIGNHPERHKWQVSPVDEALLEKWLTLPDRRAALDLWRIFRFCLFPLKPTQTEVVPFFLLSSRRNLSSVITHNRWKCPLMK